MIHRHAVRIHPKSYDHILSRIPIELKALEELYEESVHDLGMPYFLVADRLNPNGLLSWGVLTAVEFASEYRLESYEEYQYKFRRMPYETQELQSL